jgi:hypothetical protein
VSGQELREGSIIITQTGDTLVVVKASDLRNSTIKHSQLEECHKMNATLTSEIDKRDDLISLAGVVAGRVQGLEGLMKNDWKVGDDRFTYLKESLDKLSKPRFVSIFLGTGVGVNSSSIYETSDEISFHIDAGLSGNGTIFTKKAIIKQSKLISCTKSKKQVPILNEE